MAFVLDFLYFVAAVVTSPFWLTRMIRTGKVRTDWAGRFGRTPPQVRRQNRDRPRILLHAVSVGEVNAIRTLVDRLAAEAEVVIAATTDTGIARARDLFSARHHVVRFPFDFSWAVHRFLRAVQPDLVALVELEVWPNIVRACVNRRVPIGVINGRLSAHSFRGYRRFGSLLAPTFARLSFVAAQDDTMADRFVALGSPRHVVRVLGTMKWDTAPLDQRVDGTDKLADVLGVDRARPVVVAGSTGPGEEALIHAAVPPDVQLIIAPRKPERFDEAAAAVPGCVRRSQVSPSAVASAAPVRSTRFLLDSIGELRAAYSLADVVIVGRTFANLHGSDLIEPAAMGKATIAGPDLANFEAAARALLEGGGLVQVSRAQLPAAIARLLADADERRRLGEAAREIVRYHRGATDRHVECLRHFIAHPNRAATHAAF